MPRRQQRKRARIHDPRPRDANDPRPGIHHRIRIVRPAHPTRTRGVVGGMHAVPNHVQDLGVAFDLRAGEVLPRIRQHGTYCPPAERLPDAAVGRNSDRRVDRIGQSVWVDDWQVQRRRGRDSDAAAGQPGDQGREDGRVLVPVSHAKKSETGLVRTPCLRRARSPD